MKSDLTNTLVCRDCNVKMSPAEAYGQDRGTCPNPSCRGDLELTDKGRQKLGESVKQMIVNG